MSSSCSIGCLFVFIASLAFLGAAARRSLSGQDWFLPATLGNSSMRDAIEKAWTGPYLREFATAPQCRSNSVVRIRAASRFRGPANPAFPWLAGPRARTQEFRQSYAPERTVLMCYSLRTSAVPQPADSTQCHTDTFELRLVAHNGRLRGSPRGKFPGRDPPHARGYSAGARRSRTVACDSGQTVPRKLRVIRPEIPASRLRR